MRCWCILLMCSMLHTSFANALLSQFENCNCSPRPDKETEQLLKKLNAENHPPIDEASLQSLQSTPVQVTLNVLPQIHKIETREIPGPVGPIKTRFYFPRTNTGALPVFVFFHGGGWVVGSLDEYDALCQEICCQTPCIVASVEYHLAPQYTFPVPLEDCYTATTWIAEHIQELGGDTTRLAIGGDSAGGNLAAAVTLMARERGLPRIDRQVLIYPVMNNQFDTLSYFLFADGYFLTRDLMQLFWNMYLPQKKDGTLPYASPLQAATLDSLPPTLMVLANFDPLRDEGLAYAWRLHQANVPVVIKRYDTIHGCLNFAQELTVARTAIKEIAHYLAQDQI